MTDEIFSPFADGEQTELMEKLFTLTARQAALYTAGDSSSLPVETARELYASIRFCLRLDEPDRARKLLRGDIGEAYNRGLDAIRHKIEYGKHLWLAVCGHMPEIENTSLSDTLKGIGGFWARYDFRFFAHQIPCDIDYQLAIPLPETLAGIDYINRYLESLAAENDFLLHFSKDAENGVLRAYCPDPRGQLINLYEPIASNALGRRILGGVTEALRISEHDCRRLEATFSAVPEDGIESTLRGAAAALSRDLGLVAAGRHYLEAFVPQLSPRVAAALRYGGMDGVFLDAK